MKTPILSAKIQFAIIRSLKWVAIVIAILILPRFVSILEREYDPKITMLTCVAIVLFFASFALEFYTAQFSSILISKDSATFTRSPKWLTLLAIFTALPIFPLLGATFLYGYWVSISNFVVVFGATSVLLSAALMCLSMNNKDSTTVPLDSDLLVDPSRAKMGELFCIRAKNEILFSTKVNCLNREAYEALKKNLPRGSDREHG